MSVHWHLNTMRRQKLFLSVPRRARLLLGVEWVKRALKNHDMADPFAVVFDAFNSVITGKDNRGSMFSRSHKADCKWLAAIPRYNSLGDQNDALMAAGCLAGAAGNYSGLRVCRNSANCRRAVEGSTETTDYFWRPKIINQSAWDWARVTFFNCSGPDISFNPAWRTTTVVSIAKVILHDNDLSLLPILADALQDAGCDYPCLMEFMQSTDEFHTRADWVVWNALDLGS